MNNRDMGKSCGPAKKMADGGSVDSGGFWERIKAGNIDQPGSEAYNKYGKGKDEGIVASDTRQLARNESAKASAPAPAEADTSDAQSRRVASSAAPVGGYDSTDVNPNLPKTPDTPDEPAKPKVVKVARAPTVSTPKVGGGLASGMASGATTMINARSARDAKDAAKAESTESPRQIKIASNDGKDLMSTGIDPVTLLPNRRANGGLIGEGRSYGKK